MEFEWNEAKCLANIAKHRIDFAIAESVFGEPHIIGSAKTRMASDAGWPTEQSTTFI